MKSSERSIVCLSVYLSVCPTRTIHPASRRRTLSHSLLPPPPAPVLLLSRPLTHLTTGAQLRPLKEGRAWTSSRRQWATPLQESMFSLPILGPLTHRPGPPPRTTVLPQRPHLHLHPLMWLSPEPRARLLPPIPMLITNNIAMFLLVGASRLLLFPQILATRWASPLSRRPVTPPQWR